MGGVFTKTVQNELSVMGHFGKCFGGMLLAIQLTRILISSYKLSWLRILLYIYFAVLAVIVFAQFVTSGIQGLICFLYIEEMIYLKGLGVQMTTKMLSGRRLHEFYKVEEIEELALEDVLLGASVYNALVLKMKDKDKRVVLFEVSNALNFRICFQNLKHSWQSSKKSIKLHPIVKTSKFYCRFICQTPCSNASLIGLGRLCADCLIAIDGLSTSSTIRVTESEEVVKESGTAPGWKHRSEYAPQFVGLRLV